MTKKIECSIKLTFDDLRRAGGSICRTEEGVRLTTGSLHSGSTFQGTIILDEDSFIDLERMFIAGLQPVFWISSK